MTAEVSLSSSGGAYAVVADRPLNRWWAQVQPFVRTVLLAPQPSTKESRVSWAWTQGARSVTVSRQELVAIRRALEESAAALMAAVPKEPKLRTVFDGYAEVLRALASRNNSELERYVCVTPFGPMLHSWGAPVAAIPRPAQSAELEISGTVVVMGKPDGGHQVVLVDSRGSTTARSRSDGNGHFRFANITAGRYRVRGVSDRVDFPVTGLVVDVEDASVEHLELKSSASMAVREELAEASVSSPEVAVSVGKAARPAVNSDSDQRRGGRRRWLAWIVLVGVIGLLPFLYWLTTGPGERPADPSVAGSINQAVDLPGDSSDRSPTADGGGGRLREVADGDVRGNNRLRSKGFQLTPSVSPIVGRGGSLPDQPGPASGDPAARSVTGSEGTAESLADALSQNSTTAHSNGQGFVSQRGGGPALLEGLGQDPAGAPSGSGGGVAGVMSDAPSGAAGSPNANASGSSANSGTGGSGKRGAGIASVSPSAPTPNPDPAPASGAFPTDAAESSSTPATPPPSRDPKSLTEKKPADRTPMKPRSSRAPDDSPRPLESPTHADESGLDPVGSSAAPSDPPRSGTESEREVTKTADQPPVRTTSGSLDKEEEASGGRTRTGSEGGSSASGPDPTKEIPDDPNPIEPSVIPSGEGFVSPGLASGQALSESPLRARNVSVRFAPWRSILVRDQIVDTTPQLMDAPDDTLEVRKKLLEQQRKLLPDGFASSVRWHGIGVSFGTNAGGQWRGENAGAVQAGRVGSGEAEIGWRDTELAQNREIHWVTSRGTEVTVRTTITGEILVAAREGVRVWLWVAVEPGSSLAQPEILDHRSEGAGVAGIASARAGQVIDPLKPRWPPRGQWRSLGSGSRSSADWRATEWRDGVGRRLEMPLIADAGAQSGTPVAWVDEDSGWALMTTVWLKP